MTASDPHPDHNSPDTRPIPAALTLDAERLDAWMKDRVADYAGPLTIALFKGGQSNPTYRLTSASGRYVLRRKPPGVILPGAHAIEREARVMTALGRTGFPVPRVHALETEESVIGSPFFVMDEVAGRIVWDARFPGLSPADRAAHFDAMNATIAALHGIDPAAVDLGDYGKASGFIDRQVRRWAGQYRHDADAGRVADMDWLADWLEANLPPDRGEARIVHGDYRCDNMIFAPTAAQVVAVLDWELSTLGDPVADFVYHLMMYRLPHMLAGQDWRETGIPSEDDYIAAYCARTGREHLPDRDYLMVFVMFRMAGILHGIRGRIARGNAASAQAAEMAAKLEPLAALAVSLARSARL